MPHLATTCRPIARGRRSDRTPRLLSIGGNGIGPTVFGPTMFWSHHAWSHHAWSHPATAAGGLRPNPTRRFDRRVAASDRRGIQPRSGGCRIAWRHGIDAPGMPGIAPQDPSSGHGATAERAVLAEGFDRVVAAGRPEPAIRADHWTHRPLIGPHRPDRAACRKRGGQRDATRRTPGHVTPAFFIARWMSFRRSVNGRPRVPSRPISTRSNPDTG